MTAKVIWHEGAFIRPQHFQQQERFLLHQLASRTRVQYPFGYGFSRLQVNLQALEFGQVTLSDCAGVFQDGTVFDAPEFDALPNTIDVADGTKDATVYLALPVKQLSASEVGEAEDFQDPTSVARYQAKLKNVTDLSTDEGKAAQIQLGKLCLRLFVESRKPGDEGSKVPDGYLKLPIVHILEVRSGRVKLDPQFIPTVIHYSQSKVLTDFMYEMHGMIAARANNIAARVSGSAKGSVADSIDFMLLQMFNRYEPQFAHYEAIEGLHPLHLYQFLLGFAGELSTFMKQDKRPLPFADYDHDELTDCFKGLMQDVKHSFSVVHAERVIPITISEPNKNGTRAARISTPEILDTALFVLAVNAQVESEVLRKEFPAQIKIAPGERIHRLINSALPGVEISPMPVAPPEIPTLSGFTYFELNTHNELWQELKQSKGLAFHVAGQFPGLQMQFWAINRT